MVSRFINYWVSENFVVAADKIGENRRGKSGSDRGSIGVALKFFCRIGGWSAKPKFFAEIATLVYANFDLFFYFAKVRKFARQFFLQASRFSYDALD